MGWKGRVVAYVSKQLKHCKKRSVMIESLTESAATMTEGDRFLSFDMYPGYHELRLDPAMTESFIFKYHG